MKNHKTIHTKLICVFSVLLVIIMLSLGTSVARANPCESLLDIEAFKSRVIESPDECWKKPAENRKDTILNKLAELQELINQECFEEAYDKMLHDIKPKLTCLKEDELGEPWGNGVFKNPWVTCDDLQVEFCEECDWILNAINPQVIEDDDKTPPEITIIYNGGYSELLPGTWEVTVEDLESGLDTVTILVDESEWITEALGGMITKTYSVPVPALIGPHDIEVTAMNNDMDRPNDQETRTKNDTVVIEPIVHDDTAPNIFIQYDGSNCVGDPGDWKVYMWDEESGIGEVYITASFGGDIYHEIQENLGGLESKFYEIPLLNIEGIQTISVIAINDISHDGVQETATKESSVEIGPYIPPEPLPQDDNSPPEIEIVYEGGFTGENPGTWSILVKDSESGLDDVLIEVDGIEYLHDTSLNGVSYKVYLDIPVPGEAGIHLIKVTATNDIAYDGVQETGWKEHSVAIDPPIITIYYEGSGNTDDPGYWTVVIEDPISGIGNVVILINGEEYLSEDLGGVFSHIFSDIPVPSVQTTHTIEIFAKNVDNSNETYAYDSIKIVPGASPPPPPIIV